MWSPIRLKTNVYVDGFNLYIAATVLGTIGGGRAVDRLIRVLDDDGDAIHAVAAKALGAKVTYMA
jgi:aconitase B